MMRLDKNHLLIRQAFADDINGLIELSRKTYDEEGYSIQMVEGQLKEFPHGQVVADYKGEIVGFCSTFRISGNICLREHTWRDISGNGFSSRHNPEGDFLYVMEICVDEAFRGLHIGHALYDAKKNLCRSLNIKGIVLGSRMPGFLAYSKIDARPSSYVNLVRQGVLRDPVINFHLNNQFEIIGFLPEYLPSDDESLGHAVHMLWSNPDFPSQNLAE